MKITAFYCSDRILHVLRGEQTSKAITIYDYEECALKQPMAELSLDDIAQQHARYSPLRRVSAERVIAVIPRQWVSIHYQWFPSKAPGELAAMVALYAEKTFPQSDHLLLRHSVVLTETSADGSLLMITFIRMSMLSTYISCIRQAYRAPDAMVIDSWALVAWYAAGDHYTEVGGSLCGIVAGAGAATQCVLTDGRSFVSGLLRDDRFATSEAIIDQSVAVVTETFAQLLKKRNTLFNDAGCREKIILTGKGAHISELVSHFNASSEAPVDYCEVISPIMNGKKLHAAEPDILNTHCPVYLVGALFLKKNDPAFMLSDLLDSDHHAAARVRCALRKAFISFIVAGFILCAAMSVYAIGLGRYKQTLDTYFSVLNPAFQSSKMKVDKVLRGPTPLVSGQSAHEVITRVCAGLPEEVFFSSCSFLRGVSLTLEGHTRSYPQLSVLMQGLRASGLFQEVRLNESLLQDETCLLFRITAIFYDISGDKVDG